MLLLKIVSSPHSSLLPTPPCETVKRGDVFFITVSVVQSHQITPVNGESFRCMVIELQAPAFLASFLETKLTSFTPIMAYAPRSNPLWGG